MGYPMNSWSYIYTWHIWSSHICTWHDRCFLCFFMVYMVLVWMYFLWMVILVLVLPMILFLWSCLPIISSSYIHVFLWKGVAPIKRCKNYLKFLKIGDFHLFTILGEIKDILCFKCCEKYLQPTNLRLGGLLLGSSWEVLCADNSNKSVSFLQNLIISGFYSSDIYSLSDLGVQCWAAKALKPISPPNTNSNHVKLTSCQPTPWQLASKSITPSWPTIIMSIKMISTRIMFRPKSYQQG